MTRTASACLVTLALALAGCGDDKKSSGDSAPNPATVKADAAEAKSAARNATSQVESCFTDTQDYSQCKDLPDSGLDVGSGPGQVRVLAATPDSYRVEAYTKEGAVFAVVKQGPTATRRVCSGAGCPASGTW